MKQRLIIIITSLLSLFFLDCKRQLTSEPETKSTQNVDTLIRTPAPGVVSSLEFVKDSYNLDDIVYCHLVLRNESSTSPFIINASYPAYRFFVIYEQTGDIVTAGPSISYDTEEFDTLRIGDSLTFDIKWTQNIYNSAKGSSGLKVYSGKYLLETECVGNSLLQPMNKYFDVTDIGFPLSADLEADYTSTDSIKATMTVRNRLSTNFMTTSSAPVYVTFVSVPSSDTVLTEQYSFVTNVIAISAHTDSLLFYYKKPRSDPQFDNFKGGYKIIVTLNFQIGTISDWSLVYF